MFHQKVEPTRFLQYAQSKTTEALLLDIVGQTSVKMPSKSPSKRSKMLCDKSDSDSDEPVVEDTPKKKKKKATNDNAQRCLIYVKILLIWNTISNISFC